jgi:hypothetical protein
MRGGLRLNPDNPLHQTVQVAVDYVRFKHIDKFVKFHNHVRSLPDAERLLTWTALALAGVVVIATPVLAGFASRFTAVSFQDVQEQTRTIPAPAIMLAFLAFSIGWGYLLTGAAQGPALLWIVAGLLYSFLILIIGLNALRFSPLHAIPMLLLVAMGALTPSGRLWGKIGLIVLMTSFFVRLSLPPGSALKAHWYVLWPVAIAALVAVHRFLARRPWPSPVARTALASAATVGYFFLIATTTHNWTNFATWLHVAFNTVISYLDILWFLLGASFVGGAIALAVFARKAIERVCPPGILHWAILGGWIALAVWALRSVPKGAHGPYDRYAIGILLASLLVLATWWRMKRITREWLAGWFVASAAAVLSLRTYLSLDMGSLVSGKADARVLLSFAYAITWEVASHIRNIPLSMRGLPQPAPVLLYLGMVLTICGASLFGLSANLKYFQEAIVLNEYQGALSLGLPLGLLAAAGTWPLIPQGVIRRSVAAFLLASGLAIPAFLLRAATGPWVWPLLIAGLVAFTLILARFWPEIDRLLAGAALGCATGMGFAVVLSQHRVFVDSLWILMSMVAAFSGVPGARGPAEVVQRWAFETVWRPADVIAFVVAAPLLTTLAGAVLAAVKQKSRSALVIGENAPASAPPTGAAHE